LFWEQELQLAIIYVRNIQNIVAGESHIERTTLQTTLPGYLFLEGNEQSGGGVLRIFFAGRDRATSSGILPSILDLFLGAPLSG